MALINAPYPNFFLENEIADQLKTHLAHSQFAKIDTSLETNPGMKKLVNVYTATEGTQKLTRTNGNTKSITPGYTQKEYNIVLAQTRFEYYDEDGMTDPIFVQTGVKQAGSDMWNVLNDDIVAAYANATLEATGTAFNFDLFVDAASKLNRDSGDAALETFALLNVADTAKLRKALKDDLKYVEAYSRQGYVGTVAGINIYTSKIVTTPVVATKDAVTLFVKKNVEVEQIGKGTRDAADANVRKNTVFARRYYVAALTDATKAVKLTVPASAAAAQG